MATTQEFQSSLDYIKAQEKLSFLPGQALPRFRSHSAMSELTEIADTDYDSDSLEGYSDSSPYRSNDSLVAESVTTVSTADELKTPDSTGLTAFHFHLDDNPIKGPSGPHLFRANSQGSVEYTHHSNTDYRPESAPNSATTPFYYYASKLGDDRRDTPLPNSEAVSPRSSIQASTRASTRPSSIRTEPREDNVLNWSPNDVVHWMRKLGFEDSIVEKFYINDISGAILLELQAEDLKELDIPSFGKRHQLMGCIRQLRRSSSNSSPQTCESQPTPDASLRLNTVTPQTNAAEYGTEINNGLFEELPRARSGSSSSGRLKQHRQTKRGRQGTDVAPEDSVSIVAIEQLLPKLHTCSKGENCRKWQKQQAKLAWLAKDVPPEYLGGLAGGVLVTGDPGNPSTAQALARTPKSDVTPSLIASSDIMGPAQSMAFSLSHEMLSGVQPRDPQENVRNFLQFQSLGTMPPATDPATPPIEHTPSPDTPESAKANPTLSENLRHLPKLRIPSMHASLDSALSPDSTAMRTVTPTILRNRQQHAQRNMTKSPGPYGSVLSPSDFYRDDPHYGQSTPMSEVDAPMTAIPMGPVARDCSQSVPPDMRFGGHHARQPIDPIARPSSTKPDNHRRLHSAIGQTVQTLVSVDERLPLPPIETPEDLDRTPRAPHCKNNPFSRNGQHANDIIHSGWMKKRKTTKLIRHEWDEHHFILRGTQLSMFPDEDASRRDSKALEHIDVDDYAVACSSLASNSKLTAAFKKTVLKRNNDPTGEAAFAFSLIPATSTGAVDRKHFLTNGPKPHHFAVKTRDERIDWMRELMLAKALKKGREGGDLLHLNGTPF